MTDRSDTSWLCRRSPNRKLQGSTRNAAAPCSLGLPLERKSLSHGTIACLTGTHYYLRRPQDSSVFPETIYTHSGMKEALPCSQANMTV